MDPVILTIIIVAAVVAAIFLIWAVGVYNGLVQLRHNIDKAWQNIDVLLLQRYEELPPLVEACMAYMEHEKELLESVTQLRTGYTQAKERAEKVSIENQLADKMTNLGHAWESYPDLKASQNFLQIQSRVSEIANQIADRREFFNDSVNTYNIRIKTLPDMIVAKLLNYHKEDMLQVPDEKREDRPLGF